MSPHRPTVLIAAALITAGCPPQENVTDPQPPPPGTSTATTDDPVASASAPSPSASASVPTPEVKTIYVREMLADCEGGAGPMKCMQIRESPTDEWMFFYQGIDGFKYEESFAYELRVEITKLEQAPADGSTLRYKLIEVVKKEKVP